MEDIIDTLSLINEVLLPVIQCKANAIEQDRIKVWREGSTVKVEIKTK